MRTLMASSSAVLMAMSSPAAFAQQTSAFYRTVERGHTIRVDSLYSIEPNCQSDGRTIANLLTAPQGGRLEFEYGTAYPNFPTTNVRHVCNARRIPATNIYYTASPGFVGQDSFNVEQIYPNGFTRQTTFTVYVR